MVAAYLHQVVSLVSHPAYHRYRLYIKESDFEDYEKAFVYPIILVL